MKCKVSDYVFNYLAKQGIEHVFMFAGGGAMHLVDSLGKHPHISHIPLFHEQACAMAAETYARVRRGVSAVLVTTGPGGTNTITGVAAAFLESTPMIVISGQCKTSDLKEGLGVRQRGNQEIGIVDIVHSVTKYAVTVKDPQDIQYHLQRAFYEATTQRNGPVWLDIPLDVQATMIETDTLRAFTIPPATLLTGLSSKVAATYTLLQEAERPVLIAGQGIARGGGEAVFRQLAETLQIPVLTSWIATDLLAHSHPLNMGKPGMIAARYSNFAMQRADLVMAIGTRLDAAMIGFDEANFAPLAKKIIVDIDKNELNKFSFQPELAIQSDATEFIKQLLVLVQKENSLPNITPWWQKCRQWRSEYPLCAPTQTTAPNSLNPYHFIKELSMLAGEEALFIPGSSGMGIDIFWLAVQNKAQWRMFATGSLGSMGYGLPASLGGCIATGKRTICVEGDGSFQLNIQELASVKGMNLPLKIFVLDNGGYNSIESMQHNHFEGRLVGANAKSGLHMPKIEDIARAYGLTVFCLENEKQQGDIIRQTLEAEGPALCVVKIDASIQPQPKVMSAVDENGKMVSGKLENLYPFLPKDELIKALNISRNMLIDRKGIKQ